MTGTLRATQIRSISSRASESSLTSYSTYSTPFRERKLLRLPAVGSSGYTLSVSTRQSGNLVFEFHFLCADHIPIQATFYVNPVVGAQS
jgi:hypothetical protein